MMETDDQLRKRIRYVAGDIRELSFSGEKLDELAWRFNLKRRKIDRETTQPFVVGLGFDPGDENSVYQFTAGGWTKP